MASSPGQILDQQEVPYPAKDHSHRKDRREKEDQVTDNIHSFAT